MKLTQVSGFIGMKNFLRALKFSWPYRGRLLTSIFCALIVALLWGANFTAIYPVLKLLTSGDTLQEWIDKELAAAGKKDHDTQTAVNAREKIIAETERWPDSIEREERLSQLSKDQAKDEAERSHLNRKQYWYRTLGMYVDVLCPNDRFQTLVLLLMLVVVGVIIKGVFEFWQESLVGSVVSLSLMDIRKRFYRNALHLDQSQFTKDGTHEMMARFTNDMEQMGQGTKTLFGKVIAEPLKAVSCIVFACLISWRLTLLFLVLVPVALLFMSKVGRYMKKASKRVLESMSSLYRILQESFLGIKIVKAFTMERYERRRFYLGCKDFYKKGMYVINLDAISGPVMELLGVIAVAGALIVGAFLVMTGETRIFGLRMTTEPLDPESLLQLYAFLVAIADPVRKLSNVYTRIQSGTAAADRIFTFIDRQPKVRSNPNALHLPRHALGVEFRDICFSYNPEQPILTNIRLEIRHGETIALVGKNGSGKTTLVGLLPRFFDADHGTILIDGIDTRKVNLRSLRKQIGLVTQETILFEDSIHRNIAYGSPHATQSEIEEAAKKAYAHDFIMKLKEGYDTKMMERGEGFSGGQKQRIALARAILRDPSILILDEATSAADLESEALIHKALREFMQNRTTIVITHRLSTLEIANRIVVLEAGRIEAIGTHAELMKACGTYQRLHEIQFIRQAA